MKLFWDKELLPKLAAKELEDIKKLEGTPWPDHSKKFLELAKKTNLSVPGVTLPGEPSKWDQVYRNRPKR